ncbi:MAG: ImmA/IrrE family metallo-endopeptidase [Sphingomicrobium sp.]
MSIKPIKSEQQHAVAIDAVAKLMGRADDEAVDQILVYQALIEQWERSRFPLRAATPVEAIKFRMEQAGLTRRDLVPVLGTKSRVSEILSGQRQLTVDQIRGLNRHFGIPAESLLGASKHEPSVRTSTASQAAVAKLKSLKVMKRREDMDAFLARASQIAPAVAMLRKTRTDRTNAKTDLGALEAWCSAVLLKAEDEALPKKRSNKPLGKRTARELAQLSAYEDGPLRAVEFLKSIGILLITMEHLPGTFLDGAAICRGDRTPVIALTLRHDRIDNFWFTLLHEFAHVCLHLNSATQVIIDDLDVNSPDGIEQEADEFARDALIPRRIWREKAREDLGTNELIEIAEEASVHPAIVAGRWRWQNSDYRRFVRLLGHGEVRKAFE